jgi:hypothetical protein
MHMEPLCEFGWLVERDKTIYPEKISAQQCDLHESNE